MARIEVDSLLVDPDFLDNIILIRRELVTDPFTGRSIIKELASSIKASVQNVNDTKLLRESGSTRVEDLLSVYSREILSPDTSGSGYADLVEWLGSRYEVKSVAKSFNNFGRGWSHAICVKVEPSV